MKIFIGFGYNPRDKWIQDLVIPFVRTLDCEVLNGEDMQGEELSQGVIDRVNEADALLAIMTRREVDGILTEQTHEWVISELTLGIYRKIPAFELREKGVTVQRGIGGSRQRYEFDDKALLLFEILKFIMKEKRNRKNKIFNLLPSKFVRQIIPSLDKVNTKCYYRFHDENGNIYQDEETKLIRQEGGLGIFINKIPTEHANIQVEVRTDNGTWSSAFISVKTINVTLIKH